MLCYFGIVILVTDPATIKEYSNGIYTVRVINRANYPTQVGVEIYKSGTKISTATLNAKRVYYYDNYSLQVFIDDLAYSSRMGYMESIALSMKTASNEVNANPSVVYVTKGGSGSTYLTLPTIAPPDNVYNSMYIGGSAKDWVTYPSIQTVNPKNNFINYGKTISTYVKFTAHLQLQKVHIHYSYLQHRTVQGHRFTL